MSSNLNFSELFNVTPGTHLCTMFANTSNTSAFELSVSFAVFATFAGCQILPVGTHLNGKCCKRFLVPMGDFCGICAKNRDA